MHLEMRILAEALKGDEGTASTMCFKGFALLRTTSTAFLPARDDDRSNLLWRSPSA
jgi:hypothetical protein